MTLSLEVSESWGAVRGDKVVRASETDLLLVMGISQVVRWLLLTCTQYLLVRGQ